MAEQAKFGRKWLAGIIRNEELSPEEKEEQIMNGHIGVTDGLKDKIDELKAEAAKVPELEKALEAKDGGEDYKKKYEDEHKAFEDFKKQVANEAEAAGVKAAYRKLLVEAGISDKRLDSILKVTDFSKMKRDKDGNLEGADELRKAIDNEWGDFKVTTSQRGAEVANPPKTGGKVTKTKDEIMAIKDDAERQQAILENHELFNF